MKRIIFIFVGVILIITGIIVTQSAARVTINNQLTDAATSANVLNLVGWGVAGLGLIFAIVGIIGVIRNANKKKRSMYIMQYGTSTEGTVNYVDKNYTLLVNNNPIYSIVEYTFTDKTAKSYTRRISNISSELVIRKQIIVGSKVIVKYLPETPNENVLVLTQ